MKKILALAIVAMMAFACVFSVSAAEKTLPDLDCSGWWTAHSEGVEVTADGITVTFDSTTYADAVNNWNGPLWVLYTSDDATITYPGTYDAPNYVEYWAHRVDNYGWGFGVNRWSTADELAAVGVSIDAVDSRTDGWTDFLSNLKAGISCTLTVKLEGSNAVATFDANGIYTTISLPVDTSKPVYLALTGELATLTNIKVITPDPVVDDGNADNAPTGDLIVLPIALMCISAGAVLTLKKKVG